MNVEEGIIIIEYDPGLRVLSLELLYILIIDYVRRSMNDNDIRLRA